MPVDRLENYKEFHSVQECIDEFLLYISAVKNLSPHTVKGYREDLKHLECAIDLTSSIDAVTVNQLRSVVGFLSKKKYAVASINRFIVCTHKLFDYCKKNCYIQENIALEVKNLKMPKLLPKFMTQAEIDKLCMEPDKKNLLWPARDKAIFEMLYSSGCRVSELASLKFSDFTANFESAVVMGKGSKERYVFFEDDARQALRNYIAERKMRFPQHEPTGASPVDYIFLNQKGTVLTTAGIRLIVNTYSGIRGVNNPVTPHVFRHTFATSMLMNGADIRDIQAMLGHESINATQRYAHVSLEQMKQIYNQAFPHSGKND